MKNSNKGSKRGGFTLIEVLVVVTIIAILAGLTLPAVMSARRTALVGMARSEISQLESGVSAFQAKFGVMPPSGISLYESPKGWFGDPSASPPTQGDARSIALMRRLWPQYDFSTPVDINGNGTTTDVFMLDGAECLVFFLGGLPLASQTPSGVKFQCIGFSANVATPFAPLSASQNRIGPFFEFASSRFQDNDGDGFLEYRDRLGEPGADPIVYYSMYEGAGYLPTDQYVSTKCGAIAAYQSQAGIPPLYFKSQSFQIISPGFDGTLGSGGYYDAQDSVASLTSGRPTVGANAKGQAELDNLTNFNGGQLKDGGK